MRSPTPAIKFPSAVYSETVLEFNFRDSQQHFFDSLLEIHQAHALMLGRQRIISRAEMATILSGLMDLDREKILSARYDGTVEDLFYFVERELSGQIGEETAGKLHIARSRNDIDVTLYRMRLRHEVLDLGREISSLREALIEVARQNLTTVMPAHTHTQPAQPTTFAHYLAATLEFLTRDLGRFRHAFDNINCNPLGACAITTTGFAIDRQMTARLLGFEGLVENSYYAIGGIDYLLEAAGAMATAAVNLGRFTQDLLLWSTQEFSYLTLNDGYVQGSSIMPQKRNPVALEHVRILLSKTVGQSQALLTSVHNTPFGDINDVEDDLQPLVFSAFSDARRAVKLLRGAIEALIIDRQALRSRAGGSLLTMTELADTLTRREQISFRLAHRLVGATARKISGPDATHEEIVETLMEVAGQLLDRPLRSGKKDLLKALCPLNFVEVRNTVGGPSPATVKDFLARQKALAVEDRQWIRDKSQLLTHYPAQLERASRRVVEKFRSGS
jgi:argininosuccinate lyase